MAITNHSNVFDFFETDFVCGKRVFEEAIPADRKFLSKCCQAVLEVVSGNRSISVVSDLDLVDTSSRDTCLSSIQKIRFFVQYLRSYYRTESGLATDSIARLKCLATYFTDDDDALNKKAKYIKLVKVTEFYFLKELVQIVLQREAFLKGKKAQEEKHLAMRTLDLLGRFDPRAEQIHRECAKFLKTDDPRTELSLRSWLKNAEPSFMNKTVTPFPNNRTYPKNGAFPSDELWKIRTIFLGAMSEEFVHELTVIGKKEGFSIKAPFENMDLGVYYWLRDLFVITPSGRILMPRKVELDDAFWKLHHCFFNRTEGQHPMGHVARYPDVLSDLKRKGIEESFFYFEAGNMPFARNQYGQLFYISGQANIQINFILRASSIIQENLACLKNKFDQYSPKEKSEMLEERLMMLEAFVRSGIYFEFSMYHPDAVALAAVIGYRELIAKFSTEFETPVLVVGDPYEMQAEYHLDMFLAPGPNGLMFIQDYEQTVQILEDLLKKAVSLQEKEYIENYLGKAKFMTEKFSEQVKHIGLQLKLAGFNVCFVPGVYHLDLAQGGDFFAHLTRAAYINCVFGANPQGETYCITMGSISSIDHHLQAKFAESLYAKGINRVYFIGRPSSGEPKYGGGLPYVHANEKMTRFGGMHCMTMEMNGLISEEVEERLGWLFKKIDGMLGEDLSFSSTNDDHM